MGAKLRQDSASTKEHGTRRLIMLLSMLNEMSMVFCASSIGHNRYYFHSVLVVLTVILAGIPLVYSEICVAQYTKSDVISTWGFFPLFRGFGYGTVFIMVLKLVHITVICSWYSLYTLHSASDSPPWFTCEFTNDTRCMVKRVNMSIFQHCLDSIRHYDDCKMCTASYLWFETKIGGQNTFDHPETCFLLYELLVPALVVNLIAFLFVRKNVEFIGLFVKILLTLIFVCLALFCIVTLSSSGSWMSANTHFHWEASYLLQCMKSVTPGFVMLGTGSGMITFVSRDLTFRSAATSSALMTSLLTLIITLLLAIVIFSGINTMSYYHGMEENIIEMSYSNLFQPLGSVAEIFSYFDANPLYAFMWFLMIFFSLLAHLTIVCKFFFVFLTKRVRFVRVYKDSSRIIIGLVALSFCPLFSCSDLLSALTDALEITQLVTSFSFSISLYWFYGFNRHSVDIAFMIGVKSSYFWKVLWCLNPVFLMFLTVIKITALNHRHDIDSSYMIKSISLPCNDLILFILLGIYCSVVLIGTIKEIVSFCKSKHLINIFFADENWGPKERVLFKSRQMFMSEIMTTEFLYRQLRARGCEKNVIKDKKKTINESGIMETYSEDYKMRWSALTSN